MPMTPPLWVKSKSDNFYDLLSNWSGAGAGAAEAGAGPTATATVMSMLCLW